MEKILDIWFKTGLTLDELAKNLRLADVATDYENVFEWSVGDLNGQKINISRLHNGGSPNTKKSENTIVSVYRKSGPKKEFSERNLTELISRLKDLKIQPLFLGEIVFDNDNKLQIVSLVKQLV